MYLESLVKPGLTRLSILLVNFQKPGESSSTMVYQACQAFNQTFGARVLMKADPVVSLHAHRLFSDRACSCKKDPCSQRPRMLLTTTENTITSYNALCLSPQNFA